VRRISSESEAAALAMMAALPMLKLGLAYVKFGPLWRPRGRPARPQVLSAMLAALEQEFCRRRGLTLRIMPPADPDYADAWIQRLESAGFRSVASMAHSDRYFVDLRLSEAEQLASLGAKWRANLRKASTDLDVREVDPRASLPDFMHLYGAMSERKRFVDQHQVAHAPALVTSADPRLNFRLFMAYAGGRPVAGSILVGSGERIDVPYTASHADALPLRAGYALRWAIINRLRGSGAKWLDLGGHDGNDGLRHFKAGNVGSRGRVVAIPGEFECAGNVLSFAATRALDWAHGLSRLRPLQRIANLL